MINLSSDIHSLTDFKRNTNDFMKQMKESGNPVVLTVNGKAELVVQDAASYQSLLEATEPPSSDLATEFQLLTRQWRRETAVFSSITKKVLHPAYQRIIGMGPAAIPLILRELEQKPGHWFWALHAISGANPVSSEADFDTAVSAWLEWGRGKGYIR